MDNETFIIKLAQYVEGKKSVYKIQVEIIHRSVQVIRFRIFAGSKSMIMEKRLLKRKAEWKIKETNFPLHGSPQEIAQKIMEMQDAIDYYLEGSPKPVNKYGRKS
jgi:hypothetical protein